MQRAWAPPAHWWGSPSWSHFLFKGPVCRAAPGFFMTVRPGAGGSPFLGRCSPQQSLLISLPLSLGSQKCSWPGQQVPEPQRQKQAETKDVPLGSVIVPFVISCSVYASSMLEVALKGALNRQRTHVLEHSEYSVAYS